MSADDNTRAPWASPGGDQTGDKHGCVQMPDGVFVNGWRIATRRTPILGREELRRLESALGAKSLPEMTFGSELTLTHQASGVQLAFTAADALHQWKEEALPPVQVACAASWSAAHEKRLRDGAIRGWSAAAVAAGDAGDVFDWTFTTPYGGSLRNAAPGPGAAWRQVDERIDRTLLLARDPILFYDELTLYESELDDNGTMSLTAKVRVMPACWYVLMRYWLRVDGVLVRLRETRVFCATADAATKAGGATVLREQSFREETFEGLRSRGAPCTLAQYPDGETASQVLLAAGGPVSVTYHRLDCAPAT